MAPCQISEKFDMYLAKNGFPVSKPLKNLSWSHNLYVMIAKIMKIINGPVVTYAERMCSPDIKGTHKSLVYSTNEMTIDPS